MYVYMHINIYTYIKHMHTHTNRYTYIKKSKLKIIRECYGKLYFGNLLSLDMNNLKGN